VRRLPTPRRAWRFDWRNARRQDSIPLDVFDPNLDALTKVIAEELQPQLAMSLVDLDDEDIEGIAGMIAAEVLGAFEITPRVERPAP
jgi:hypothetical protein